MARSRKRSSRGGGDPFYGAGIGDLLDATPVATLDLHGDRAIDAQRRVRDFIVTQSRIRKGEVVHVITGRGRGSRGMPALQTVVKKLLSGELDAYVHEFDKDLDEGGYLVRLR